VGRRRPKQENRAAAGGEKAARSKKKLHLQAVGWKRGMLAKNDEKEAVPPRGS